MADGTESSGYRNESGAERMHPDRANRARNDCSTPERCEDYAADPVTRRRDLHYLILHGGLTNRA